MNWLVRFKNPLFWASAIPAALLLAQLVLALFGIDWDYIPVSKQLLAIADAALALLAVMGIPLDYTTAGFGDSQRALQYTEPNAGYTPRGAHAKEE